MVRWRRYSQIAFFALFLWLLFQTRFHDSADRLPYPVSIFLEADPLAALITALSTRSLYRGLWWSLVLLIPTLLLGRFFCGWICPLGSLNHFVSNFKSEKKRGKRLIESNRYKRWQTLKYYLLVAILAAALLGSAVGGILDPVSLLVRGLALSLLPGINYGLNSLFELLDRSGIRAFEFTADALVFLLQDSLLAFKQPYYRQAFLLGAVLIAILVLNTRITRFWCRALCPLGALLGWASRWSILGLEKHASRCDDCTRCLLHCQGGDDPIPGAPWRKAECHLCMNCVGDCPEGGVKFAFFAPTANMVEGADLRRRKTLTSLAAGAGLLPLFRSTTGLVSGNHERLIRPPGALHEKSFLERCIRCGQCMKVCPNNALHPTFSEAGLEGLWSPVLVPRIGYCEPSCLLCGQVCPTGAIWEFSAQEKGWTLAQPGNTRNPIRLGTAFLDRGRCLPWAMASECIVCEEWCPTSPKAIYLRPAEVADAEGRTIPVRQPYVDPARCVGCGACEYACPVKDRPAVYVTSVGESRSRSNQLLLPRKEVSAPVSLLPEGGEAPGWMRTGPARAFEAENLWQYIDGDAERYLQAGVERTVTARYTWKEKHEAVADVHIMKTPDGARRIFLSESAAGSRPIPLGDGGRLYGMSLTFTSGRFLVRVTAYDEDPALQKALVDLGRATQSKLR